MDLIHKLVKNVVQTRYEDLPALAIEVSKILLDVLYLAALHQRERA